MSQFNRLMPSGWSARSLEEFMSKPVLPESSDWQHWPGAPGYFVTKDGRFQMLMTRRGQFAICRTAPTAKGFAVVRGPASDPEKLGIPAKLLEEAEALTAQQLIDQLEAGQRITVHLASDPGGRR